MAFEENGGGMNYSMPVAPAYAGGGFGGCTVNLVAPDRVESFVGMIRSAYLKRFGVEAKAYI